MIGYPYLKIKIFLYSNTIRKNKGTGCKCKHILGKNWKRTAQFHDDEEMVRAGE